MDNEFINIQEVVHSPRTYQRFVYHPSIPSLLAKQEWIHNLMKEKRIPSLNAFMGLYTSKCCPMSRNPVSRHTNGRLHLKDSLHACTGFLLRKKRRNRKQACVLTSFPLQERKRCKL